MSSQGSILLAEIVSSGSIHLPALELVGYATRKNLFASTRPETGMYVIWIKVLIVIIQWNFIVISIQVMLYSFILWDVIVSVSQATNTSRCDSYSKDW